MDVVRILVTADDRIQTNELDWFANFTYWRVADVDDKERWDGTARIDKYYHSLSAMIQSNEEQEDHDTEWSRMTLMRIKEEWAQAMFMPPVDSPGRVEFKAKLLSQVVKNDGRLDVAEARIIAIYLSRSLAYNTDPLKNSDLQIERSIVRMLDLVGVFPRLDLRFVKLADQDAFLQGLWHMLRYSFHYVCLQAPPKFTPLLARVAIRLKLSLEKTIKFGGCPGTREWRQRVNGELQIFAGMTGAGNQRVDALDCTDSLQTLYQGGPYGYVRSQFGYVRTVHFQIEGAQWFD